MKTYTPEELEKIITSHKLWLLGQVDGTRTDLREANLSGANLRRANLSEANLSEANLSGANLRGADLREADLRRANLSEANLREADLRRANLSGANLREANLSEANLSGADLREANLSGANLSGAYLRGAYLRGAYLSAVELLMLVSERSIVPAVGCFRAFKKVITGGKETILEIEIPALAARVGGVIGRKCRASEAVVIKGEGHSSYNPKTEYIIGKTVAPDSFDPNPLVECSNGIHFFMSRKEAENYSL